MYKNFRNKNTGIKYWAMFTHRLIEKICIFCAGCQTESIRGGREFVNDPLHILKRVFYQSARSRPICADVLVLDLKPFWFNNALFIIN